MGDTNERFTIALHSVNPPGRGIHTAPELFAETSDNSTPQKSFFLM
jgi:hypothetical protein